MPRNDEYYKQYEGIRELLMKAYYDAYGLHAIERKIQKGKYANYFLRHICELLKADLVLNLWKIEHDNGMIELYESFKKERPHFPKNPVRKGFKDDLRKVRNTLLAHNNMSGSDIDVKEMIKALDYAKEKFNTLCDQSIDDRTEPVSKGQIFKIRISSALFVNKMI